MNWTFKLFLISLIFLFTDCHNEYGNSCSVDFKGICLGKSYGKTVHFETLSGFDGDVNLYTNDDNIVYKIIWISRIVPYREYDETPGKFGILREQYSNEVLKMIDGLNKKYNLKLYRAAESRLITDSSIDCGNCITPPWQTTVGIGWLSTSRNCALYSGKSKSINVELLTWERRNSAQFIVAIQDNEILNRSSTIDVNDL